MIAARVASGVRRAAEPEVRPGDVYEMGVMRGAFGGPSMNHRLFDLDARLNEMDASHAHLALLSLNPPGARQQLS